MNGHCLFLVIVCLGSVFLEFTSADHLWTSQNFCFWTSSLSNGQTQYMFLYQTTIGTERSLVLFDSTWSKEYSLVDCTTSTKHSVIKSFSSKCSKDRDGLFSEIPDERIDISMLIEPDGPCVVVGSLPELRMPVRWTRDLKTMDHKNSQKLNRSKRAWIIPGTLWCGSGNKTSQFSDLGLFVETDMCCREHDHCEQTIASFEFGYGIFNTNFFTLSHCDCDSKFRHCLQNAHNRVSDIVGHGYFNLLKMRCFEFSRRMECAERTWWGKCIHREMTTYASLRDATNYTSTLPVLEDENLHLSTHYTLSFGNLTAFNDWVMSTENATKDASKKYLSVSVPEKISVTHNSSHEKTTKSLKTHRTDSRKPESTNSPTTETVSPRKQTDSTRSEATNTQIQTISLLKQKTETTDSTKKQIPASSMTQTTDSSISLTTDPPKPESMHLPEVHVHPKMETKQKGKLDTCKSYKDLDSCPYQIPALQEKFGLHNNKRTTLYHCDCTARLARELAGDEVDKIHFCMLDFVSQFCFFLPQNCTESKRCSASSSNDTPLIQRWTKQAAVWRHLVVPKRKARRFNSKYSRRRSSPIRMHRKCLRMRLKLHKHKNTEEERSAQ